MSIDEQQAIADEVLKRLAVFDPYAIVAGGAPRDWYLGMKANDIDVFINFNSIYTQTTLRGILRSLGFDAKPLEFNAKAKDYKLNPHLKWVFDVKGFEYPVQLIFVNNNTFKTIDTFPLDICKIWYKTERGIVPTKAFKEAVETRTITKCNPIYADEQHYIKKIRERFRDYRYKESP